MDYVSAFNTQPETLAASRRKVVAGLAGLDLTPWRSGSIAVAAIGASSHAGHVFAHRMTATGRRVHTVDAAEVVGYGAGADLADSFVLITEGGRSRETIEAATLLAGRPKLALTNVPAAPIGSAVDAVLGLGHGQDSRVYTIGYTATVQALGLLAEQLTGDEDGDDWDALPGVVTRLIAECRPQVTEAARALAEVSVIDVVGSGISRSAVLETALMLREGPRISAAGFETYQYLHGPMESQRAGTGCILFGGERESALARFAARHGIVSVLVTSDREAPGIKSEPNLYVVTIPSLAPFATAVAQILPVQLLIAGLAEARGIDLDEFLYDQDDTKVGPPLAGEGH